MTNKTKDQIKAFFTTGSKPNQSQFIDLIDSYVDKSGPVGTIETACSAGSTGFLISTTGTPSVTSYSTVITSQASTTAQAVSGTDNATIMTPVLVKNAISSQAGGSTILIGTKTASTSASLDFTSMISSSYSSYMLVVENLLTSTSASINLKLSSDNGSSYAVTMQSQKWGIPIGTSTERDITGVSNTTPALLTASSTASLWNGMANFTLSSASNMVWESLLICSNGGSSPAKTFIGLTSPNGINAFQLIPSAGTFTSGKVYFYGIKNS